MSGRNYYLAEKWLLTKTKIKTKNTPNPLSMVPISLLSGPPTGGRLQQLIIFYPCHLLNTVPVLRYSDINRTVVSC